MEFTNMIQKRLECDQSTLTIGLMYLPEQLLGEDIRNMDLTLIKEHLINNALNFNNHLRQLLLWLERPSVNENKRSFSQKFSDFFLGSNNSSSKSYQDSYPMCQLVPNSLESTKGAPQNFSKYMNLYNKLKNLNRNEFFVYSASVSFSPYIKCGSDLLNPSNKGGVVYTITAKMPVDEKNRKLYLYIFSLYLGKKCHILDVKSENPSVDSILSSTNVVKEEAPAESSTVLKPIPKYFDEDYSDEDPNENKCSDKPCAANTYSFFRHSSHLLSKYATSRLVMREDDEFVTQRLLQVKLQRNQKNFR